jgi:putative ABC transport system ATP-binding protein
VAAGNIDVSIEDDWIDYGAAGATGPEDLLVRLREVLVLVDLENDVYRLGLRSRFRDPPDAELEQRILTARNEFHERLVSSGAERYVEMFDPDRYTVNASVLENLVFGVALTDGLGGTRLEDHPYMVSTIATTGLEDKLAGMGLRIAETLIDLFGDLAPDNPLLERMDLMAPEEIEKYRAIVRRTGSAQPSAVEPADRQAILKLAFGYIEPRHRLGLLDPELQAAIVDARHVFRSNLPAELSEAVHFHRPGGFNPAASIQDNVLFGRIVDTYAEAADRVNAVLRDTLSALQLTDAVIELGLAFDIGSGAKRLSLAQQQKVTLGRALVKRPDFLIVNRALPALDAHAQDAIVTRVLDPSRAKGGPGFAVYWVMSHSGALDRFDRVLRFENGRLAKTEDRAMPAQEPSRLVKAG